MDYSAFTTLRRFVAGNRWPVLSNAGSAAMLAMQFQLDASQWLAPEELRRLQLQQVSLLLEHAQRTVPYYRRHLADQSAGEDGELTIEAFQGLPVLSRSALQQAGTELCSQAVPKAHGKLAKVSSSGSTGRPVSALTTDITRFFWRAITLREHLWHRRDFSRKLAAIRPEGELEPGRTLQLAGWGPATDCIYKTGGLAALSIRTDIDRQAAWLQEQDPDYLLTLPSNLVALAEHSRAHGWILPKLKEIRTLGEVADEKVRSACREAWGAGVVDMYSATEVGYLALQCPETGAYHVQEECVLLEILDDEGQACAPGEVGRVVVTTLHNFATPLIRYELGDYAEVGPPCSCGRGLAVLNRILGRQRNMLVFPDGRRAWPSFPSSLWEEIGTIRQIQFIQTGPAEIEVNYAAENALKQEEKDQFSAAVAARLGHPFVFSFVRHDEIPRSASGKYEDFISLLSS